MPRRKRKDELPHNRPEVSRRNLLSRLGRGFQRAGRAIVSEAKLDLRKSSRAEHFVKQLIRFPKTRLTEKNLDEIVTELHGPE